jgi:hypothetical protein
MEATGELHDSADLPSGKKPPVTIKSIYQRPYTYSQTSKK